MKFHHLMPSVLTLTLSMGTFAQASTALSLSRNSDLSPVYTVTQCSFQIKNQRGGYVTNYPDSSQVLYSNFSGVFGHDFGFSISCEVNKNPEEIDTLLDVKKVQGKWVSLDNDAPFLKKQDFVMTEIKGFNWTGRITEYDDLYGISDINKRGMSFCLVQDNGPQALCGRYGGPPNARKTISQYNHARNKILDVLKTIVFVDGTTETSRSAAASTAISASKNDGLRSVYTDGECHFRIQETTAERYRVRGYSFDNDPFFSGFGVGCEANKNREEIDALLDVKKVQGKWVSLDKDAPFLKKQHFVMTEIKGFNWIGRITEYDTLYGMPDINIRVLSYCLVQDDGMQALCGRHTGPSSTQHAMFKQYKHDRKKILDVLKTVVFVDGPTETSRSATASTAISTSKNDGLRSVYTDGECHFRIKETAREKYRDRGYAYYDDPFFSGFGFGCEANKTPEEIDALLDVKKMQGKWVSLDNNVPFLKKQNFVMTEIKGFNWTGRITEYDDHYGMPDINKRGMSFCLVQDNGPQALCGRYGGPPNARKTISQYNHARNKILDVLKTIVFVDGPTEAPRAATAPSTNPTLPAH